MRNRGLRTLLLLVVAVPLAGQTAEWKTYKNTGGNFTVLFPGDPTDSVNQSDSTTESHTLMVQVKPAIYTVVYTTMASPQTVDNATYETFKNAVFKELPKCEVATDQPAAPAIAGYIGRLYRLNCDMPNTKVTIVGNLYWGKRYAYAVMVMFPSDAAEPSTGQKFLDSFSVIGDAK